MRYIKLPFSGLVLAVMLTTIGCGGNSAEKQPVTTGGESEASTKTKGQKSARSDLDLKHPQVVIETSLGIITVQLDGEKSPRTVDNFLSYVDAGSYDKTIIHQVYKNQAIIAGGYTVDLSEIPRRTPVGNEAHNGLKNIRYSIAMFRKPDVIDSATSQFFINLADNKALDYRTRDTQNPEGYGYCVFGQVVKGMDVVDRIAATPVQDTDKFEQTPVQAVVIKSIHRVN